MMRAVEFIEEHCDPPVRGWLHTPDEPGSSALVLTHGAGADSQSSLLVDLAEAFCDSGLMVFRCDLPFRQLRPKGPPPRGSAEGDRKGLRNAVEFLRGRGATRVYLGGHSYGGRQASMLVADEPEVVESLLLLSYPLHPPKKPEMARTVHFQKLRTPAMFVHGTRDGFGTVDEMKAALELIQARTEFVTVEGAGHELLSKRNAGSLPAMIVTKWREFVRGEEGF